MTSTATTTDAPPGLSEPTAAKKTRGGGLGRYILVRFLLIFPTVFILVLQTLYNILIAFSIPVLA